MLQSTSGQDFDREYIDAQVRGHNKALQLIDRLLPRVQSAGLKTDIQNARPRVELHLREAERIQQGLLEGTTKGQPFQQSSDSAVTTRARSFKRCRWRLG